MDLVEEGDGGKPEVLIGRLEKLQEKRKALEAELASAKPVPRLAPKVVATRLAEWRRILRQGTMQARGVLGRVLADRITFTQMGHAVAFEAPTRFSRLFAGITAASKPSSPPKHIKLGDRRAHEAGDAERESLEQRKLLEDAEKRSCERVGSATGIRTPV